MFRKLSLFFGIAICAIGQSQNDLDVIRYSRAGVGGSARFLGMGGAFGAVGADLSVAAFNPAGLALYRRGDLNFGAGLRISNNSGKLYNTTSSVLDAKFVFNNFGLAGSWKAKNDPDSRHIFAFANTQLVNFSNTVRMGGYTNSQSIARDMLNHAEGQTLNNLNNSYEGLGYDTFFLDYDSLDQKYFSFLDINRTVNQTRDIETSGRVNDLNFSYAYTYKDQFYLGASIGFPQVDFTSTMTHSEVDDKDSMRVTLFSDNSYTTTYTNGLPFIYNSRLGFNSMTYEEYFKTSGSGFNFKIGGIYRLNDFVRIGGYYHTPTFYRLTDRYSNTMTVSFDQNKNNPETLTDPADGGVYSYRMTTPAKISFNTAFIIAQKAVIAVDYETVNYKTGSLNGSNSSVFKSVNNTIQRKYTAGHNVRVGAEYNAGKFQYRAGYNMNGSPFGDVFSGEFVRNTISLGAGYRADNNLYIDAVWYQTFSDEDYYLYNTMDTRAKLKYKASTVSITIGVKF